MSKSFTIVTPCGMLGYGYPELDFWSAVDQEPDVIIVDSGSTDPGPYLLGSGAPLVPEDSYIRDLRPLLQAAGTRGIPVVISSAGGAGTNAQVDWMVDLIDRIAAEEQLTLRVASIYADIDPAVVEQQIADGHIQPNVRGESPSVADVEKSSAIVAQMGAEPFVPLLTDDRPFDVIVAGRAYDPAPYAGFCFTRGIEPGIAWHLGKILECGASCAIPKGGGVVAKVSRDAFEITPMSPHQSCTPLSVAAHTLYEKSRPDLLTGPSGVLDVRSCTYTPISERTVRVTGSRFEPSNGITAKVEGAGPVGYRTIFIGGVRDPILVGQVDSFLESVEDHVRGLQPSLASGKATVKFHIYGRDAVMGPQEPESICPHEIGILCEVTAPTQEQATAVCASLRVATLHKSYPGQKSTAGNLALPLTPLENPVGPVFDFTLYHVMEVQGHNLFPITSRRIEHDTIGAPQPTR